MKAEEAHSMADHLTPVSKHVTPRKTGSHTEPVRAWTTPRRTTGARSVGNEFPGHSGADPAGSSGRIQTEVSTRQSGDHLVDPIPPARRANPVVTRPTPRPNVDGLNK